MKKVIFCMFLLIPFLLKIGCLECEKYYYAGEDEEWHGRLFTRTDYNAGNVASGIPNTHYHLYEWGPGKTPLQVEGHIEGEYIPWK